MPASDDFGAEQVVHVERADQPVALVDHQQLVDLVPLHQLHGLDRQRLGANGFGPGRHEAVDGDGMEVGAFLQRAVQLAVGARLWGQASCSTAASRSTSASRASAESARPVMAINFAPRRFTSGTISSSSSLDPEYEMATNTSPLSIIPRSPWLASAGCTK